MTRDSQRAKVYGAEDHVARLLDSVAHSMVRTLDAYGSTLILPDEVKFGHVGSIQGYVDDVLALTWVKETWPGAGPVRVRERRGQTKAHYRLGEIAIPPYRRGRAWAMREIVVLHELAHHLNHAANGYSVASHGPEFTATFVRLVQGVIGPEVGLLLAASLHEAGAKIGSLNRVAQSA